MEGVKLENEYAYVVDGKVFLKGYLEMPDRQIGEVKSTQEEAVQYFEKRYEIAVSKVNQLEEDIENAQNKGSYLTKLLQLRKRLLSFDGIGNFIPLLEKLDVLEKDLVHLIEENQKQNLEIKRALIEEAKKYHFTEDWKDTAEALQEIRSRWIRIGPVEKDLNESVDEEFKTILDEFYQARKAFFDEQNKIIDERIKKYHELTAKAEMLLDRDDWDEAFLDLKNYQTEWKIIGEIPPKLLKSLFKDFKKPTSIFYERYCQAKGIQPKRKQDPRVEMQLKMVTEAERLSESDDIFAASNRAKVLLNEWKTIRIPAHLADRNIAERFRAACDKIFELGYLYKVISRKYPTFNYLSDKQKDLTKYREMENIVKRARTDYEDLVAANNAQDMDSEMGRMVLSNQKTQKRKLLMKEIILEELRHKAASV